MFSTTLRLWQSSLTVQVLDRIRTSLGPNIDLYLALAVLMETKDMELQAKDRLLNIKDQALDRLLIAKDQALIGKDRLLNEQEKLLIGKEKVLDQVPIAEDSLLMAEDQALIEKEKVLDQVPIEKDRLLLEKDRLLLEKDRLLSAKDQALIEQEKLLLKKDKEIDGLKEKLNSTHASTICRGRMQLFQNDWARALKIPSSFPRAEAFNEMLKNPDFRDQFSDCKGTPVEGSQFKHLCSSFSGDLHKDRDLRPLKMLIPTDDLNEQEICILDKVDKHFFGSEHKSMDSVELYSIAYRAAWEDRCQWLDEVWGKDVE